MRAAWPRPWSDDAAADRAAFERACREVGPEEIITAARAWAAAADAPRYLPSLAKWLNGRGWEKLPPTKRARRTRSRPRSNGHKVNLAKLALMHGGYVEGDDGAMVFWGGVQ